MQLVETSSIGVRSATYHLVQGDNRTSFDRFPMLHVTSPDFYARLRERFDGCDLILMEDPLARNWPPDRRRARNRSAPPLNALAIEQLRRSGTQQAAHFSDQRLEIERFV